MGVLNFFKSKPKPITESAGLVGQRSKKTPQSFSITTKDSPSEKEKQFKIYKKAYETVPLVKGIVDVQSDQAVQEFHFRGPSEEKLQKWGRKINLMQFFHRVSKLMLIYGSAFAEVIKEGEEITELKILDSVYVNVYRTPTGETIGYSQIIGDKKYVLWGTTGNEREDEAFETVVDNFDSIVHFKHNVLGSEKYGLSLIKPLIGALNTKISMENDLRKIIFKYVAPLIWAKVGNDQFPANQTIVSEVSNELRDINAESEFTTSHLVDLTVLDFNAKGMDIKTPLDHVEQQIITGGLTPPVLLGRESATDSEVQLRGFGRHIKALQRELTNEFEDNIIVGQGIGTSEDELVWTKAEEREWEIEVDIVRGLVTDGILTPQKANDLLPPKYQEKLPEIDPLNAQGVGPGGVQQPRPNQMKNDKVKDNPNNPQKTTKNKKAHGKRVDKNFREIPGKK